MQNNMRYVQKSRSLREGAIALVERCVQMAGLLVHGDLGECRTARGGRKAHELDTRAQLHGSEDGEKNPAVKPH